MTRMASPAAVTDAAALPPTKHLQCTEVWGGNHFVDSAVEMPGLDLRVYSRPYGGGDAGGGDVHYVSTCAAGQISRIVVADVCGHGADVAQVASLLRALLRRYVIYHSQKHLVRSINRRFVRLTDVGCFATAVVGTFDAADRRLSVSNAGHPPPLHYRAAAGTWDYLARPEDPPKAGLSDLPLGIENLVRYGEASTRLDVGDLVLFYIDALPEARKADGQFLGQDGLLALIRQVDPTSRDTMIGDLLRRIEALSPGNLAAADVTLLLLRANGERPWTTLPDYVLAPVRAVRSVVASYPPE